MVYAKQAKNGSLLMTKINDKVFEIPRTVILKVNKLKKCEGHILCYDVDQETEEAIITKGDLINMLIRSKPFEIILKNEDPEVDINIETKIVECELEGYDFISSTANVQFIRFNFSFDIENVSYN